MDKEKELDKLKNLIFSGDDANIKLAKTLAEGIGGEIEAQVNDICLRLTRLLERWGGGQTGTPKAPSLGNYIKAVKERGFSVNKVITDAFPDDLDVLAPYIKRFYLSYMGKSKMPKNLKVFSHLEEFKVASGDLLSLPRELWEIPTLKSVEIWPAKRFDWGEDVVLAQNLEHIRSESHHVPNLPKNIMELPKLNSIGLQSTGSPTKNATPLPKELWACQNLQQLTVYGPPYLLDEEQFEALPKLSSITLTKLSNWETLPESWTTLKALKTLKLYNLRRLKQFPTWFADLRIQELALRKIKIKDAFKVISQMPNLQLLELDDYFLKQADKTDWQAVADNVFFL